MPNTWDPWSGESPPLSAIKSFETSMSPPKTVSNNIVSRVENASFFMFHKADTLKHKIDNFGLDMKEWGTPAGMNRKMNDAEKNLLEQAKADYKEIQSEKKNLHMSLDEMGSLFDEKSRQSAKLSEDAHNIECKLNEIDNHLSEYEGKLKLLEEKGEDKTDEEIAWEMEARRQMSKLKYERTGLSNSLTEIHSLQTNLDNAESTTTKGLESLLGAGGEGPPRDSQSAEAINNEMAEIKGKVSDFCTSVSGICAAASNLFSNLFESIKNISSKIASQFKSTNDALAESEALLSNYPTAGMQPRL